MSQIAVHRPADIDQLLSVTAVPGSLPGRVVVEVVGEIDAGTAPLLQLCLDSQATQPGLRELVVDLARVTFLGAAGAAVLAEAHRRCRERGARLVVRSGGVGTVLRPLHMTGLEGLLTIDPVAPGGPPTRNPQRTVRPRPRPRRPRTVTTPATRCAAGRPSSLPDRGRW